MNTYGATVDTRRERTPDVDGCADAGASAGPPDCAECPALTPKYVDTSQVRSPPAPVHPAHEASRSV